MMYGIGQVVGFTVIDTSTGKGKVGDAANLTLRWLLATATSVVSEQALTFVASPLIWEASSSSNMPGSYFTLVASVDTLGLSARLHGKSSTANIEIIPRDFDILKLPNATPTNSGGLLTVGTGAGQITPSGGNMLLAATGSVALAESYAADGSTATLAQLLYMIWSNLAERSTSGTTLTNKKLDGVNASMTFTLDNASNPTSQTRAT